MEGLSLAAYSERHSEGDLSRLSATPSYLSVMWLILWLHYYSLSASLGRALFPVKQAVIRLLRTLETLQAGTKSENNTVGARNGSGLNWVSLAAALVLRLLYAYPRPPEKPLTTPERNTQIHALSSC